MKINTNYLEKTLQADLKHTIQSYTNALAKELNCVRIGIVQEFFDNTNSTVKVKIASKYVVKYNQDGTQTTQDYPVIYAKICYCNPYETFPLFPGDEVVLLFNDRELETWFINGQANAQQHQRMHDLTDCIAIAGIRSLPKMIEAMTDCLHLFYGNSDIQLKEDKTIFNTPDEERNITNKVQQISTDVDITASNQIKETTDKLEVSATTSSKLTTNQLTVNTSTTSITGTVSITGATSVNGALTASSLHAQDGATGIFTSGDGKLITVTNGIIVGIV